MWLPEPFFNYNSHLWQLTVIRNTSYILSLIPQVGKNMARITVEDCLENVENRFKLVLLASKRARQLEKGADEFVPRGKDKSTVLALCLPVKTSLSVMKLLSDFPIF